MMKKFLLAILLLGFVLFPLQSANAEWLTLKKGTTSKIIQIPVYDSSSTTGGMLTGLVYNSAGLTAYYNREAAAGAATAITLVTATKGTWTSSGFVAVDGTNMPGWYELHVPDAALATGANSAAIHLKGATNMVPVTILIQLDDNNSADVYTRLGAPTGASVSADVAAVKTDTAAVKVQTDKMAFTVANKIDSNVYTWSGTAVATPDTAGYPKVTIKSGTGAGEVSLSSGTVTVGTNNDKTGYSLTQAFPTNFSSLAITAGGAVTVGTNNDKTGYSLTSLESAVLHSGTAQAGAAGTITLAAGASATNDLYKGLVVRIYGGTGAGQARTITAYDGTTKVATVAWNWTTTPDATSTYAIVSAAHPAINSSLQVSTTASDPWATALPGAYGAGTAGKILGDNLNATVSSRLASSAVPTNFSSMAITAGGAVTVGTNNDKTGYSLTQSFPANFASMLITAPGKVTVGTNDDKTGYSLTQAFPTNFSSLSIDASGRVTPTPVESMILASGTAQAGAAGTITLAAGASATDDLYKGLVIKIYGGTGAGQARTITAYDGTTKVATVAWNWTTTPDATSTYAILAAAYSSVNSSLQVTAASVQGNVTGSVGSVTGAVGSVTGGVTVTTNNDKTGYSLTQTFPANFSNLAITATTGKVTVGTNDDKTGYSISGTKTTLDALNDVSAATVWGYSTRTLTSGGYSGLTATDIDNVWEYDKALATGASAIGKHVVDNLNATVGSRSTLTDAQVWSYATRTLTSYGNDPSAATVAAAVWNEPLAGYVTAGTAGKKLSDLPTTGTGDWTSGEKTLIKQALGINDGDIDVGGDMDSVFLEIRRTRGR